MLPTSFPEFPKTSRSSGKRAKTIVSEPSTLNDKYSNKHYLPYIYDFWKKKLRRNQDVSSENCSHFIGTRKEKRKTPRQKRKQKRKPGIAHVGQTCFHIDFILVFFIFVTFFGLFSLPLMEWSFTMNNNSTYITQNQLCGS